MVGGKYKNINITDLTTLFVCSEVIFQEFLILNFFNYYI